VGQGACRRRCKPAAIRTLAYLVNECHTDAMGFLSAHAALRIRRGDHDSITVLDFPPGGPPVPDPLGTCRAVGESRFGWAAVVGGGLERLGVSPDGSGVVYEVTYDTAVLTTVPPFPVQQGIFFVRADGSGRRYLGPASRDPSFRTFPDPFGRFFFYVNAATTIPFSPNGRRIAFTDLGPGHKGEEAVQIVVLDLATGQRTQVTHLPVSLPPAPSVFPTGYPQFIGNETIRFFTFADPDGSNPQHDATAFTVRINGSRLGHIPTPVAAPGSRVIPIFGVARPASNVFALRVPGETPVNGLPGPAGPSASAAATPPFDTTSEIFVQDGKNLLQLTDFHRVDTGNAFPSVTPGRAFFTASADPLGTNDPRGGNPSGNCQIFSIDTRGGGLRQITHFNAASPVPTTELGCYLITPPECPVGLQLAIQDPVTKAVVFDSSCDPLGAN